MGETRSTRMTDLQWAVICTIHQTAGDSYRFLGDERKVAERMANCGLLRRKGYEFPNQYSVTPKGERMYSMAVKP
jgi:hypothetical protein